ncbi:MAG: ATP-binding protein [Spirochaetaceae bacterium]|nr:MAG: ATP-binding protein [Spirochaetaceae bacterium]
MAYYTRRLDLRSDPAHTFFLWGPRQSGKSTLIAEQFPDAPRIDLLRPDVYRRYLQTPELLIEEQKLGNHRFVVVDEIQRVPELLDAVHWLIENRGVAFALCGSSARKVRRGHANLLGGRGIRHELHGLSAIEIGDGVDIVRMLNHGYLPTIYDADDPRPLLDAYVSQYLQEEVAAEGLSRRLPAYADFLGVAALSDGSPVSYTSIARETGVASQTVRSYFGILEDTLLGRFVPAYRRRPKRRTIAAPKFYFADVGIVNFLARRGSIEPGSELFGYAFENWVFHELCCFNAYEHRYADIAYWRLSSGIEVDFIVNHIDCAIEAKATRRVRPDHLKGLRELSVDHPEAKNRIIVSLDTHDRKTNDGIEILHYKTFLNRLWSGSLF